MPGYESEKPEGYHPVNARIKETGESNGSMSVYTSMHRTGYFKPPFGLHFCFKRTPAFYVACVSVILNVALIALAIAHFGLSVGARRPSSALPACQVVSCPSGWLEYQGKCYYFAKDEGNWTSSKRHCSSLNASLAVVDSHEEMDFMMRYKGVLDHWIGLQRNLNNTWVWTNGTIFDGWFEIPGRENCGNMNQQGIDSSSCSREEPWICSKPLVK